MGGELVRRRHAGAALLAVLFFWPSQHALTDEVSFTGWLVRAGNQSVSIRLADRRVICALLPDTPQLSAAAMADRYRMGDEVEVTATPIRPVWEEGTSRYQYLKVTAVQLVERPSPEKLATILAGVPFREGDNLLEGVDESLPAPPMASLHGGGSREWEHARRVNLDYTAHLPNFVADEVVERYRSSTESGRFRKFDTLETEITFRGNRTIRRNVRRNGKAWEQPFEALPGFKWYGGFGSEIRPLFDARCPFQIDYGGRTESGGHSLLEYDFSSDVDGCFPYFYFEYQRFNPARAGRVFIDEASGNVMQLEEDSHGFPPEFELAGREEHIYWDLVKIGEGSHLLPVRAECVATYYSGTRYRIEVEFKNHRHFEASTNIQFR